MCLATKSGNHPAPIRHAPSYGIQLRTRYWHLKLCTIFISFTDILEENRNPAPIRLWKTLSIFKIFNFSSPKLSKYHWFYRQKWKWTPCRLDLCMTEPHPLYSLLSPLEPLVRASLLGKKVMCAWRSALLFFEKKVGPRVRGTVPTQRRMFARSSDPVIVLCPEPNLELWSSPL